MKKIAAVVSFLFLITLTSGCLELERHVWLNPDGSGKATIRMVVPDTVRAQMFGMTNTAQKPEQQALELAKTITGFTYFLDEGSDYEKWYFSDDSPESGTYWDEVDFGVTEDDALYFSGTVYFKDYNNLFDEMGYMIDQIGIVGDIELIPSEDGLMYISEVKDDWDDGLETTDAEESELTDEQKQFKITQARAQIKQTVAMLTPYLKDMTISTYFYLPGEVTESIGFAKFDQGVAYYITGKEIVSALEEIINDEDAIAEFALSNKSTAGIMENTAPLRKKLFGTADMLKATIKPLSQFDFTTEAENARAWLPQLKQKLGFSAKAAADESSVAAKVLKAEVAGVSFIRNPEAGDRFKDKDHYSASAENKVSVYVDFDTPVNEDDIDLMLKSADDDKGRSLLSEENWIYVEYSSDDQTRIAFEVELAQPYKDTEYIKGLDLAAEIAYKSEPQLIDLGEVMPAENAVSQNGKIKVISWEVREDAAILAREQLQYPEEDREEIEFARIGVQLDLDLAYVSDLALFAPNGKKLNAYGNCGDQISETAPGSFKAYLNIYEKVPDFIILKVIGSDKFEEAVLEFSTGAFDLMGNPVTTEKK
jgi:hypothetical protein